MKPNNYPAYLINVLKNDLAKDFDPEAKKYAEFSKDADSCYAERYGECSPTWDRFKETKNHSCHWCKKFENYRKNVI